jgi:predicted transcriptional regulator of viral defense system
LSAAALHGAAHQQPQQYHVVVGTAVRPIESDIVRIQFFRNKAIRKVAVEQMKTYTGYINASTPASTALDLVRFQPRIGGLDAVLTVLVELGEKIKQQDLIAVARKETERSQVQRLGWLLDRIGHRDLSEPLADWLKKKHPTKVALDITRPVKGFHKDARWQIIVNAQPQGEL